jgi:uncharacterized RDD family membrane protein YckC
MKESFGKTAALEIRTPEGVVFSQPLASPVSRFLAYSLDFLVILALQIAVGRVLSLLTVISRDAASAISIATFFLITVGYGMFFEWLWSGRTIGKRVVGLRVIDEGGLPLKGTQVIVRNLMRFIDAAPVFYFVGGMACLISRRCQRLGDLVAGTLVVRIPRSREPRLQEVLGNRFHNAFADHPHLEARLRQKVSPEEGQLVMNALVRRDDLEAAERVNLYAKLADYFRELVAFPEEAVIGLTDEQYLRNVADTVFRGRAARG